METYTRIGKNFIVRFHKNRAGRTSQEYMVYENFKYKVVSHHLKNIYISSSTSEKF